MIVQMQKEGYTIEHGIDVERVPANWIPSTAVYNRIESASCRYAVHFFPNETVGGMNPMAPGSETAILTAARNYIPFTVFNGLRRTGMTLEFSGADYAWFIDVKYSNIVRDIWDISVTCNQENMTLLRTDKLNNVQDYPVSGYETASFNGWIGISSGGIAGIEYPISTFNYKFACSVPILQVPNSDTVQEIIVDAAGMLNCVNASTWRGWDANSMKLIDFSVEHTAADYDFSFTFKSDNTETMSLPGGVTVTRDYHQGFQSLPLEQEVDIGGETVKQVTPIRYQTFNLYNNAVNFETLLTSVSSLYNNI